MRHLRGTGIGSWRMYATYAYEALKAIVLTLLMERDIRGAILVLRGICDGVRGQWGKAW